MIPDLIFRLVIKDHKQITPEYLWAILTHSGKRKQVQSLASGAAGSMPNISKANLKTVKIPVPNRDVQDRFHHIYKKIEAKRTKIIHNISTADTLFASLSQRAFRGEL